MRYEVTDLTLLRFEGPRFEDHGLDLDVLPDLIAYKALLIETAKELWRRKHPDRERLPRGFEDSIKLKFYQIEPGSTGIPLQRVHEFEEGDLPLIQPDEVDEAAAVINGTIAAASNEEPLPEALPLNVIPLFGRMGQSLRPDEAIVFSSSRGESSSRYSRETRERLIRWVDGSYEDTVQVEGEVRAADLDARNFVIRLDDGNKVAARFDEEQESLITEALREHATRRVSVAGTGDFSQDSGDLKRVIRVDEIDVHPVAGAHYDESVRPVWEMVAELGESIPSEQWDDVPTDLSRNLDHYLYGARRREE